MSLRFALKKSCEHDLKLPAHRVRHPTSLTFFNFENSTQFNLTEDLDHAKMTKLPLHALGVATFLPPLKEFCPQSLLK